MKIHFLMISQYVNMILTMMMTNKKSTQLGLSTRGRLQLPITAESNMKCKP